MKNEKGFLLAESLIVSTFVLTILIILFIQFSNLTNNYKNSYSHNNVESIYDLSSVSNYLVTNNFELLDQLSADQPYILLYSDNKCNVEAGLTDSFCEELMNEIGAKTVIYTSSDVRIIKYYVNNNEDDNIGQRLREFITKIDAKQILNKGRLFAEFKNGNFSTIAFDYDDYTDDRATLECTEENIVTQGSGLYQDGENRCVFKGSAPNNYIRFNNELWRVVSLEADGTIKIIRNESESTKTFDEINVDSPDKGTYCANSGNGCNAWATNDNFTNGNLSGNVSQNTTLNEYLNNQYLNSITENKFNIANHPWNIGAIHANNDNLTDQINDEAKLKWTGKIGLISVSEYLNANSNKNQCGTLSLNNNNTNYCTQSNWIYNLIPDNNNMWTITPNYNDNNNVFIVHKLENLGNVHFNNVNTNAAVIPALYLSEETVINGGNGTITDPFTIDEASVRIELIEPTFTEEGEGPKMVTVNFQEECKDSLTCTYQIDGGEIVTVKDTQATIRFTKSRSILATVSDGERMLSNNYEVNIDNFDDSISLNISTSTTSHSITVVANATSNLDITKYEYSNDGGQTWQTDGTKNTYTFENLIQGKTYNIMVRATNENDIQETVSKQVTTLNLTTPTFKQDGIYPIIVTITFPDGCGSSFTCSYQKDNGQEEIVTTKTADVNFDNHGSVVAKVSDGTNVLTSTYNARITLRAVDLSYNNSKTGLNCEDAQCAIDEINKIIN